MLNKLIKHEWKETWKIPSLSCLVLIVATCICALCLMRMEPPAVENAINMGALLLTTLYSMMVSCATILILIYFGIRFYRNLYTDEGYLMHTLPVTPRQLILSKTLVASLWYFICSLLTVWFVIIIFSFCLPVIALDGPELTLDWLMANSNSLFGMSLPAFLVYYLLISAVSAFSNALILYGAVSLGQLFSKHKVMASILCYIGFSMLIQTVTSFAMTPYLTKMILTERVSGELARSTAGVPEFIGVFIRGTLLVALLGSLLAAGGAYILTEYMMNKQLNLD